MARKKKILDCDPWLFNGEPFVGDDAEPYAGFVYLITMPDGKKYVGKKFFTGMRKQKGKTRRSKIISDWETYFSSSEFIKTWVKENGAKDVKREILSLHTLKRDVNFCEVLYQFKYDVLDSLDENGNRVWLNDNIQGKYFPHLVREWQSRSIISNRL